MGGEKADKGETGDGHHEFFANGRSECGGEPIHTSTSDG